VSQQPPFPWFSPSFLTLLCSYEKERPPRVKAIHEKGTDSAAPEDKEGLLFKPYFKPLWQHQSPQVGLAKAVVKLYSSMLLPCSILSWSNTGCVVCRMANQTSIALSTLTPDARIESMCIRHAYIFTSNPGQCRLWRHLWPPTLSFVGQLDLYNSKLAV